MARAKVSLSLAILMLLVSIVPAISPAIAQTDPPNGAGDWTIPSGDVTWLNGSQALIQGDIEVYGTLILNGTNVFLWGSNDGDRHIFIRDGGHLIIENETVLSSYSGTCFAMELYEGGNLTIDNSRVEKACRLTLFSADWTIKNNTWLEESPIYIDLEGPSYSHLSVGGVWTYWTNWVLENVTISNVTTTSYSYPLELYDTVFTLEPMSFNNISINLGTSYCANAIRKHSSFSPTSFEFNNLEISSDLVVGCYDDLIWIQSNTDDFLRNVTIKDVSYRRAIYHSGGVRLYLDNVTIENLSRNLDPHPNLVDDSWGAESHDMVTSDGTIIANNIVMKNNLWGHSYWQNSSWGGYDFACSALYAQLVEIRNSLFEHNCGVEFLSSSASVFPSAYSYSGNDYSSGTGYCALDSALLAGYYRTHYTGWPDGAYYCKTFSSKVIHIGGSSSTPSIIKNVTIKDNNRLIMNHTYIGAGGKEYRHGLTVSHAIYAPNGNPILINSSIIENNTKSGFRAAYSDIHTHYSQQNEEIYLAAGVNSHSWINNSVVNAGDCENSTNYHVQYAHQTCTSIFLNQGSLTLTNTTTDSMEMVASGELIREWYLDVRVTDPDGEWTPNATVEVLENNFWSLGSQSTGSDGGLVRFVAKNYSRTPSTYYIYTPHEITVTMPNYSNSTSTQVYMDQYQSVIVYDPTPDAFPGDISQDFDTDGDGYGDNISGTNPDYFPNDPTQWSDIDGDGYGDNQSGNNPDRLPNDPTQWQDTDGDGYGDNQSGNNPDAFINDATQWQDTDGDGYGDNQGGNNPDLFINDATQWSDVDGDGYGDNQSGNDPDAFPNDATQWEDWDGDGHGDNPAGTSPDQFPYDVTQWYDGDDDGLGDNQSGSNPDPYLDDSDNDGYNNSVDPFPLNPTQWLDGDGDGLGDNQSGTNPDPYPNDSDNDGANNSVDPFPQDPTQWLDDDGDGFGDNQSGVNPDPYLNDSDNDGYNNSVDEFPWIPSQWSDSDGDGWGDNPNGVYPDDFPNEPTQWRDADGDGRGDNPSGNNSDLFPNDPTQWDDYDGDGHGDNPSGTLPDEFPYDSTQWHDMDGDGYGDNYTWTLDSNSLRIQNGDAFLNDMTQWSDIDGDGYGDDPNGTSADEYPYDSTQWHDADGDSFPDSYTFDINPQSGLRENQVGDAFPSDPTQWSDVDGDGYGDNASGSNPDEFPYDPTQWVDADDDGLGDNPSGNNPDPTPGDGDNDGVVDWLDDFPDNPTQWTDSDGDGYGDNWDAATWVNLRNSSWPGQFIPEATLSDYFPLHIAAAEDTDLDGYPDAWTAFDDGTNRGGLMLDECPTIAGTATFAGSGCPDEDGDGYADHLDAFEDNPTQWADSDGDGRGDNPEGSNPDAFPADATQWLDSDGDGQGDNPSGNNPDPMPHDFDNDGYDDVIDDCPQEYGSSNYDRKGCPDADGDMVSDLNDAWPDDPQKSIDTDGDGHQDPDDAFPSDATQWIDNDNDGLGDNQSGNNPDPYLDDSDNDGVTNQDDAFPSDATQSVDADGDGLGDNPEGNNPDPFPGDTDNDGAPNVEDPWPLDPTQWVDSDGDGYGDNATGTSGDLYPNDPTQCCDSDGDGWGDNPNGTNPDQYPNDPTQWIDKDGDGLGDNPNGSNADPYPGDRDNDGVPDNYDAFPDDPRWSLDSDGDGIADEQESIVMASIAESSESMFLGSILLAGAAAGIFGYWSGNRRSGGGRDGQQPEGED